MPEKSYGKLHIFYVPTQNIIDDDHRYPQEGSVNMIFSIFRLMKVRVIIILLSKFGLMFTIQITF
jgi:hypothetical protein